MRGFVVTYTVATAAHASSPAIRGAARLNCIPTQRVGTRETKKISKYLSMNHIMDNGVGLDPPAQPFRAGGVQLSCWDFAI